MDKTIKQLIILWTFAILLFVLVILACYACYNDQLRIEKAVTTFRHELLAHGYNVENGIIKSPSVIVVIDRITFLSLAVEYKTTIYGYNNEFYVFNPEMTIAYKYGPVW
jgi:hypothetical protein